MTRTKTGVFALEEPRNFTPVTMSKDGVERQAVMFHGSAIPLVTVDRARSLLTDGECSISEAEAVGEDLLEHPRPLDERLRPGAERARELLGKVRELALTVVDLWRRVETPKEASTPAPPSPWLQFPAESGPHWATSWNEAEGRWNPVKPARVIRYPSGNWVAFWEDGSAPTGITPDPRGEPLRLWCWAGPPPLPPAPR